MSGSFRLTLFLGECAARVSESEQKWDVVFSLSLFGLLFNIYWAVVVVEVRMYSFVTTK